MALAFLVLASLLATPDATATWEKLYVAKSPTVFAAVAARADDGWIAAGGALLVRGTAAGIQATPEAGRFVVGLSTGQAAPLLAVGADGLILRWDGQAWSEESFDAGAAATDRAKRRQALLQGALRLADGRDVAYGPWRVLVRQPGGRWDAPPEPERYRLMTWAQLGPAPAQGDACRPAQWRWLSDGAGWRVCHDGHSLVVGADGTTIDHGHAPPSCTSALGTVARRGDDVFATCGGGELWRSTGTRWQRMKAPKVDAVALGTTCLYAVGGPTVWRRCALP